MPIWKYRLTNEDQLRIVKSIITPLIGKHWWGVRFAYPDELRLQIGEKKVVRTKRFGSREEGSWELLLSISNWAYSVNNEIIISSADIPLGKEAIKERFIIVLTASILTISEFTINWPDLGAVIKFSDNSIFTIITDNTMNDMRYWELFTPFDTVLEIGPLNIVAYYYANEPIE